MVISIPKGVFTMRGKLFTIKKSDDISENIKQD